MSGTVEQLKPWILLSVRSPWITLICQGIREAKNRSYTTENRWRLYVHSSGDPMPPGQARDELCATLLRQVPAVKKHQAFSLRSAELAADAPAGLPPLRVLQDRPFTTTDHPVFWVWDMSRRSQEDRYAKIAGSMKGAQVGLNPLRWFKPAKGQFQIVYQEGHAHDEYVPDFVVETDKFISIAETKAKDETTDAVVLAKKKDAEQWCQHASEFSLNQGKKPWKYILVAHDDVKDNMGLEAF